MTGVLLLHGHDDRCRENPEVAGNLAAVGELTRNSGNGQGGNLVRGSCLLLTSSLGLRSFSRLLWALFCSFNGLKGDRSESYGKGIFL